MKNYCNTLYTAVILTALLAGSCSPTLYIPNMINTPLLGEKGDFKATIGGTGMAPGPSLDLQGAYALSDRLAVMANGSLMGYRKPQEWGGFRQDLVEAGLGTYKAFWPNKNGFNRGRTEVFAGAGAAWSEDRSLHFINSSGFNSGDTYRSNYQRLFLQPSFGIRTRVLDAAITTRLAWAYFSDYQHRRGGDAIEKSRFGFATIEPVLTLGLGYKYVKVFLQVGSVKPFLNRSNYYQVASYHRDGHFNGGLAFTPWKEKQATRPLVTLVPALPAEEIEQPAASVPDSSSSDTLPIVLEESTAAPDILSTVPLSVSPTLAVGVKPGKATVCIRDNGFPDGDVISVSFRGAYLLGETELQKTPQCIELNVWPGENNILFIHSISSGKFKPNTVLVAISDGEREQRHILQLEEGKTEQIHFLLSLD